MAWHRKQYNIYSLPCIAFAENIFYSLFTWMRFVKLLSCVNYMPFVIAKKNRRCYDNIVLSMITNIREGLHMVPLHVFLVGMAGSGKTTLGKKLAVNLNVPFVDTDERVSAMMNMPVEQIYATLGDAFFHNAETGVLMELIDEVPSIVSTGSGLPMMKENVQLMQNHGIVIHVDRPLDQILADARTEGRQGGQAPDHEEIIQEYNQRIGFYRACADHTFVNDHGFLVGAQGITTLVSGLF